MTPARTVLATLLLSPLATAQAGPDDWAEFLGPNRTGEVEAQGLDFDWGEDGPEVAWVQPIGGGYGGPAIRDDQVYLLDRSIGSEDILRVLDLASGEELWRVAWEAGGRLNFPGSRTVPSVTAKKVYVSSGFGQVRCIDRESHEVDWHVDMVELYGGEQPMFGWSNSPLVIDDMVVVTPLGEDVGIVALDRFTGEEVWVTEGVGYSHSTPKLMNLNGEDQILFCSTRAQASGRDEAAPMRISSFEPETGEMLWRHETTLSRLPIPGPIKIDDERFFVTGGYRGGSTMFQVKKSGSKYAFEELFHIDRGSQIHAPLRHDDHLYVIVNENWNHDNRGRRKEGGLMCLDLDGNEKWRTGNAPYFGRGNSILAGNHLIIQDGFNGVLRVVEASSKGYEQVAEANLFGIESPRDNQMWAPMALAKGHLVLRSQEELMCVVLGGSL